MKRSQSKSRLHSGRVPFVEQLEARMVLSVCGVECTLAGDILQIDGSPSNDNISVRFDPKTDSIRVVAAIPGGEEFLGQFPAASINMLNFTGFTSSDRYNVDSSIAAEIALDYTFSLDPSLFSIGPFPSANAGNSTLLTQNINLRVNSTSFQPLVEHSTHSDGPTEAYSSSHGEHAAVVSNGSGAVLPSLIAGEHGHDAMSQIYLSSASAAHTGSPGHSLFRQESTAGADSEEALMLEKHSDSSSTQMSSESKLVPKRCTVTTSGGVLVTSVYGKRECDCDQQKKAGEEVGKELTTTGGESTANSLANALGECVPCQSGLQLFGLPAEFQTCSVAPSKGSFVFPLLEEHHGDGCPTRAGTDELVASETRWLESLQYVGWPLVAASVALLPVLWERRNKDDKEDEDEVPAVDWFFGRFNVEPLLAR